MVTRPVKRPRKAVRLTFSYGADGIRLIDKRGGKSGHYRIKE